MLKVLVDVVLAQGMLDVIGFLVIFPVFVQLVNFASHIPLFFRIKRLKKIINNFHINEHEFIVDNENQISTYFVNFRKASFTK